MRKQLFFLFASLLLLSANLLAETVTYIDADGQTQSAETTEVTNSTTTLSAGWYVVLGADVQTGTLVCHGAVHLILADGAKLTAMGEDYQAGIQVLDEGNSLTIYGQTAQSGQLVAQGSYASAGIGGSDGGSAFNITINGGIITATGGENAAGIGGGRGGSGSNITINGGRITATGGEFSAGIGGGERGSGSNIKVATSLQVKADGYNPPTTEIAPSRTADSDIAGDLAGRRFVTILPALYTSYIDASGILHEVNAIVVNNFVNTVTWNEDWYVVSGSDVQLPQGAVCNGAVKLILADGAKLTVTGADYQAGIQVSGDGNSLTIYGQTAQSGQLMVAGGSYGAGIGGGDYGSGSNITINGGRITAIGGYGSIGIGGGCDGIGFNIRVATSLQVKADSYNPPTTLIAPSRTANTDIAKDLNSQRYVIITPLQPIKAAAIAEIDDDVKDITNEAVIALATAAKTNINAATNETDINAELVQWRLVIIAYNTGKAEGIAQGDSIGYTRGKAEGLAQGIEEGRAAVRSELPTDPDGTAGTAVVITKGDKSLTLINPDGVTYLKKEE